MRLFLIIVSLAAFSQEQEKVSNKDLRGSQKIIEIQQEKNSFSFLRDQKESISLEVSQQGSKKNFKLAQSDFDQFDREFVSKFIQMKYNMDSSQNKCTQSAYKIFMRGENLQICSLEKEKIVIVRSLIDKLNSLK